MIRQNLLWNAENDSTTPLRETQGIDVYLRRPKGLYFVVGGHDNNLHAFAELDPISNTNSEVERRSGMSSELHTSNYSGSVNLCRRFHGVAVKPKLHRLSRREEGPVS